MASLWGIPLNQIKGVGEKRAALYQKLGITSAGALLRHFPRSYEDWSRTTAIADALPDTPCCIKGTPVRAPAEHFVRKGMVLYRFPVSDGKDLLHVTLFNNKFAAAKVRPGEELLLFGTVTRNGRQYEMAAPQLETAGTGQRIRPIYRQTEGLTSRMIETNMAQALRLLDMDLENDPLPPDLRSDHHLATRRYALENIHFPVDGEALAVARRRLVFEELLLLQLGLLRLKGRTRGETGAKIAVDYTAEYLECLPFSLTGAQRRAIADCVADMQGDCPMSRLVQGDVGSGKTAVAAGVAFTAVRGGWQAAMMAPTELLAEQHARSLTKLLAGSGVRVGLLTGSQPAAVKKQVQADLAAGDIDFIVGTHALLSEGVAFARLGLVITDEQHRFGVDQRAALAAKSGGDLHPHVLVMSATPIPRTLALMIYGDLDLSVIDQLPPGRTPVATYLVHGNKRPRLYAFVRKQVALGRQVYIVCPAVDQEDPEGMKAAEQYGRHLQQEVFPDLRVGIVHGRQKPKEKQAAMAAFAAGQTDILVSTTVIEVGMDVPNASLMVIEDADRFGLSQLHQLRGRVGRGQHQSYCVLLSDNDNEQTRQRLRALAATTDGFAIAEEDLKLRGPGDFFGARQHGLPQLKVASLEGDMVLLHQAQTAARELLAQDPHLSQPDHAPLRRRVERLFRANGDSFN